MEGAGSDTQPTGQQQAAKPNTPKPGEAKFSVTQVSEWLQDNAKLGTDINHHMRYRRYVDLNRNEMFQSLVGLYTNIFSTFWTHLRRLIDAYPIPAPYENDHKRYAAAVYISAWFHDLYVSNRISTRKLCDAAYTEHFFMDLVHKSTVYDTYLVHLNSQIRPTNIKLTHEDTLFIPRFGRNIYPNALEQNYFNINGWIMNEPCLQGIISVLRERRLVRFETLSETASGRPAWLLDWHEDQSAYAWFPREANYTFEDVTIAFIIGEACTPHLGPRDYDEWQVFPANTVPAFINERHYQRVRELVYNAAMTFRVIRRRDYIVPEDILRHARVTAPPVTAAAPPATAEGVGETTGPQPPAQTRRPVTRALQLTIAEAGSSRPTKTPRKGQSAGTKGKTPSIRGSTESAAAAEEEEEEEGEVTAPPPNTQGTQPQRDIHERTAQGPLNVEFPVIHQYRIIDYLYHGRVVLRIDVHSRMAALRQFVHL